jgi:hypothetical protein
MMKGILKNTSNTWLLEEWRVELYYLMYNSRYALAARPVLTVSSGGYLDC